MAAEPNDSAGPAPASAAAVAGLAREVDALRRAVRKTAALHAKVDELAVTVAQAIDDLAATGRRTDPIRPVSWIAESTDPEQTATALGELADWVGRVYLRYPVAARDLTDCWLWHPDVVEELAWLQQAWQAAYGPETGTVSAAGDWHDRYRPGVAARIRTAARGCSLENHTQPDRPTGAVVVPSTGSVEPIARWWASTRDCQQPPAPTQDDLDAAMRRLQEGRR
jgi:hypothetical protein